MRICAFVLCCITAASALVSTQATVAGDAHRPITEQSIATLIGEALSRPVVEPYSLTMLKDAEILDVALERHEKLSNVAWIAEVEIKADFGPAPKGIIGFERVRSQRFRLVGKSHNDDLQLERFTPIAEIERHRARF